MYGKPTTGFAPNWSRKIQHWLHKIWAGLLIDGWSKFPWHTHNTQTLNTSWNQYSCFSRDKQHFVSFITKHSLLLTFESTTNCSAFTMNSCLFFLLSFSLENSFWEAFLVFIIHLLYNQSDVLVRSGQILHHQYDIFAVVPQTPIPRKTTVVVVLRILDCFLSYKKIENCKLLFCRLLYFLGHLAGCSSSCGRRTWMERWPVLSQSTRIIWYWQATPLKRVQGNRSPNKSHIGQEMARKFGLLCLVQVSNFFSTSGKNLWIKYSFARSIKDQK